MVSGMPISSILRTEAKRVAIGENVGAVTDHKHAFKANAFAPNPPRVSGLGPRTDIADRTHVRRCEALLVDVYADYAFL